MNDPRLSFLKDVAPGDQATTLQILGGTTIRIVAGLDAAATFAGQILLYQLATLSARLFDRVELDGPDVPCVPFLPILSGAFLSSLQALLPTLRPLIPEPPNGSVLTVVVGAESGTMGDIYLGSTAWGAKFSTSTAQPLQDTRTPVGALTAGTLGASEVFKRLFAGRLQQSHSVPEYTISLLDYRPVGAPEPELPEHVAIDATLFGCGSIGCGFLLGVLFTPQLHGTLTAVDNGIFDEKNPYKYSLIDWAVGERHDVKARWASDQVSLWAGKRLRADAFVGTAEEYVASLPEDYILPLAVSAVDTMEARFQIQDTLPQQIVNAGIDGTLAEVSVHAFGDGACLACLGMQKAWESWDAGQIAAGTGLSPQRVHTLIRGNLLMTTDDISQIQSANRLSTPLMDSLESYAGQPLLSLWNRLAYSETSVRMAGSASVTVTTAFVSAFAGVLLLAETLKMMTPELRCFQVDNSYQQQLLGIPAGGVYQHQRESNGWCLCYSSFRQAVYREKYCSSGR